MRSTALSIATGFLMLTAVIPLRAQGKILLQDKLNGNTKGKAIRVTYAAIKDGKAAVFSSASTLENPPGDAIEYPPGDFSQYAGSISFDYSWKPLAPLLNSNKTFWNIFADGPAWGRGFYPRGSIIVGFRKGGPQGELAYGICDAGGRISCSGIGQPHVHNGTWKWLYSKTRNWTPGRWYHICLQYGPGGMRLKVNGLLEARDNCASGLAKIPKAIGYNDWWTQSATMRIKNFTARGIYINHLGMSSYTVNPNGGGVLDKTMIRYELAGPGKVTLAVLTRDSHIVKTLIAPEEQASGNHSLIWHAHGLADGRYQLRLRIHYGSRRITREVTFWVDTRWRWSKSKPQPGLNHFFARGVYDWLGSHRRKYYERTMKDLRQHGINIVLVYVYKNWVDSLPFLLDAAYKNGIRVLISPVGTGSFIDGDISLNGEDIYSFVFNAIKDSMCYPALMGYYIVDEPGPAMAARMKLINQVIESEDPEHPCFATFTQTPDTALFKKFTDTVDLPVYLVDIYPIVTNFKGNFSGYIAALKASRSDAQGRPLWVAPQAFGGGTWRIPTPAEIRAQAWLALAYGAKGLSWFGYQGNGAHGGLVNGHHLESSRRWTTVGRLNVEFYKLAPLFLQWRPARFPVSFPIKVKKIVEKEFTDRAENRYVILVNTDVKRAISIPWRIKGGVNVPWNQPVGPRLLLKPGAGTIVKLSSH